MTEDGKIPQAQSQVLDASGKFTLGWFRFFAALEGIRAAITSGLTAALLKASNLSDVADAATAFLNIKQGASGTTTGVVQQTQIGTWAHTHPKAADGTFFLLKTKFAGTITDTVTDCTSGTCTVRWKINGTNVGSTANSVSTTEQTQTHSTANTFAAGDVISYEITSNSSCLGALIQANITRNLAA